MREYHAPFEHQHFYHIYNRAIGYEILFKEEKNYSFFLDKWKKYLIFYIDIWSYCLMPNHFHFLIRIKNRASFPGNNEVNTFLENQFKRLFSSYTLSFNKVYDRTGSLFQKRFKRVKVDSENYLLTLIHYIHHNPIHHNFTDEYANWTYSSYSSILSSLPTSIKRDEVLQHFSSLERFIEFHDLTKNYNKINHLIIE